MDAMPIPSALWCGFERELDSIIDATKAAEMCYTDRRGISLASMAVGSAVMRLGKVNFANLLTFKYMLYHR